MAITILDQTDKKELQDQIDEVREIAESYEIPDGSITPEKTSFTETVIGKNLVNPATIVQGALQADGSILNADSWSNYSTTDYIRIDGEKHTVAVSDKITGELYKTRIITALYDTDHNIIAGSYINDNTGNIRIIDNAEAVYLRVSVTTANFDSTYIGTQVEKGDTPTAWEAYTETVYSTLKVHAKDIDPAVVTKENLGEAVTPAVQAELGNTFFAEPKNLFHNAELVEGYFASGASVVENASYNTFNVPTLPVGTYGIYPRCRYVVNALTNTDISNRDVNGEFTFTLEQDAPVKVSFMVRYTEQMLLYNADLYTYEDVELIHQNILDTKKVIVPRDNAHGNILLGKKWAVCGDSFSEVVSTTTEDSYIKGGLYDGQKKSYGYIIGNRNDMDIQHLAQGGKTLAYPADGSFHNSFTDVSGSAPNNYTSIAEDADYITLYFGINDSHRASGTSETDGEDVTGVIPLGTIDDANNTTFCGAWNVCLEWLIQNRPFAHIGIIVSNGCDSDDYRTATIAAANKWGIPYIDLNGDERTPMMLRSTNPAHTIAAKNARKMAQAIDPDANTHPNAKALEYESTFIEAWLRTL